MWTGVCQAPAPPFSQLDPRSGTYQERVAHFGEVVKTGHKTGHLPDTPQGPTAAPLLKELAVFGQGDRNLIEVKFQSYIDKG